MSGHRRWCETDLCTPQTHNGRLIEIRSRDGFAAVTVQLKQSTAPAAMPVVEVTGEAGTVRLTIGQARALSFVVSNACRRAVL